MTTRKINKKAILGSAAMVCCIGIVALCSFFPFIIDPSRWQTMEFLSDELIVSAIVIFSTVCVMFIGQSTNMARPDSNIAKARVEFHEGVERLSGRTAAFCQWVRTVMQPRDIHDEKVHILRQAGIEDEAVLGLEDSEIRSLIGNPGEFGGRAFKSLSKKQAAAAIRAKRLRLKLVDATYYLTDKSVTGYRTITARAGKETKKKAALLTWSVGSKVLMSIIAAMIFTSLVYDLSQGSGTATAWLKFCSRMFSMATSSFMGYLIGVQTNDIDAAYLNLKCLAHREFEEDRSFRPKTSQEEAIEQIKEAKAYAGGED